MDKQYNQHDYDLFYSRFRQLPQYYKFEKVHQLINDPNAKATHKVKIQFKPLKIILMTSTILLGIAAILIFQNPKETNLQADTKNETITIVKEPQKPTGRTNEKPEQSVKEKETVKVKQVTKKPSLFTTTAYTSHIQKETSENSTTNAFKTYYFRKNVINASIFEKDSMVLTTVKPKRKKAKLEIFEDYQFLLTYWLKPDTIIVFNKKTELAEAVVVEKQDTIFGHIMWQAMGVQSRIATSAHQKQQFITFILKDGQRIKYQLIENDDRLVFCKTYLDIPQKTSTPVQNQIKSEKVDHWPEDTIIDGCKYIIKLTDTELKNLGFYIDSTGIYYKNKSQNIITAFHSRYENTGGEITSIHNCENRHNKKVGYSSLDFYPVTLSSATFESQDFKEQDFKSINDTLLPIYLSSDQLKYPATENIIWFNITPNLFNQLPKKYRDWEKQFDQIKKLKSQDNVLDVVQYQSPKMVEESKLIEIDSNDLIKLGIKVFDNMIRYESKMNDSSSIFFELSKAGTSINVDLRLSQYANNPKIYYLTKMNGTHIIKWGRKDSIQQKYNSANVTNKIQFLVPIIIRKQEYPEQLNYDVIFWFEPSKILFDNLPKAIGGQVSEEYEYITAINSKEKARYSSSCTYFEACKSTLGLENFQLIPNPANDHFTLKLNSPVELTGDIELLNISGVLLKSLAASVPLNKGENNIKVNIEGIPAGIYLVMVQSNKGFATRRLIVME